MITEDYVSFETAKLLKEKGFDEKCISVYHNGKLQLVSSLGVFCGEGYGEQILTYTNSECKWSPIMISAPTIQMAMKWLREVHRLDIDISIEYIPKKVYFYSIFKKTVIRDIDCLHSETNFKSYEETCSAAIKYCLENLI